MQLLIGSSALARVAPRLAVIAPDLDIVAVTPAGTFERGGAAVVPGQVKPDIAWLSMDAALEGWIPTAFECILKSDKMGWMQSFTAGLDRPAFTEAIGKGIRICKSNAQANAIAEYVTSHAFSLIMPLERQRAAQASRQWTVTPFREIADTSWTIIGFGSIGAEIARRVKAFDAHLTVLRRQSGNRGLADEVLPLGELRQVLPKSDVIVLACALNDETRHIANEDFFGRLKKGAILINIGRGALVDAEALRHGLERDQPAHAVLDVFDKEPLPADDWMWSHPKIRISAHTSAYGSGTKRRGDELFLENLGKWLRGEPLLNEATPAEVGL